MTTFLYSLLTAGADKMAVSDPHGWTLSIISVCVVFAALIMLYFLYSLSGRIFSGKSSPGKGKKPDPEVAAAIAMALEAGTGDAAEVAIATALHLYMTGTVHDEEPGFITIKKINKDNWKFRIK